MQPQQLYKTVFCYTIHIFVYTLQTNLFSSSIKTCKDWTVFIALSKMYCIFDTQCLTQWVSDQDEVLTLNEQSITTPLSAHYDAKTDKMNVRLCSFIFYWSERCVWSDRYKMPLGYWVSAVGEYLQSVQLGNKGKGKLQIGSAQLWNGEKSHYFPPHME